ncbi:MAG: hypothetical protein ACP5RI_03910 [Candidatus Micrarchaeia archaeon]
MSLRHIPNEIKASPIWILISSVPYQIGSIIAMLYVLSSDNENKAYSLLFLLPIIGPIISYVITENKDRYVSTLSGWVFVGQIISYILIDILFLII